MNDEKFNVGLIGLGSWGKKLFKHLEKIATCHVAISGNHETIEWLKKNSTDTTSLVSSEEILANPALSHVFVATPINTHESFLRKLMQTKKKVWIEKPATTSASSITNIIDLAKKNNQIIFCNHLYTSHPFVTQFKQLVNTNLVVKANFEWKKFGTFNENLIWNLAYHDIYLAIHLLGIPESVFLTDTSSITTNKVSFTFKYNSLDVTFSIDRESKDQVKRVYFEAKDTILDWNIDTLTIKNKSQKQVLKNKDDILKKQIDYFLSLKNIDLNIKNHWNEVIDATKLTEKLYTDYSKHINS